MNKHNNSKIMFRVRKKFETKPINGSSLPISDAFGAISDDDFEFMMLIQEEELWYDRVSQLHII